MKNQRLSFLLSLGILLALSSLSFRSLPQTQTTGVVITFPGSGSAVQGLLQINGTANVSGFQSYRLEFAPATSSSPSWFLIHHQTAPVNDDILGEWDTSILTDGDYSLRLAVDNGTDQPVIALVEGIRIRNYSPIETDTPAPTSEEINVTETIAPTATPAIKETIPATPTPLPTNSVSVSSENLKRAILIGGLLGLVGTFFITIYAGYRQKH